LLAWDEEAIKSALDVFSGKTKNIASSSLVPHLEKAPPENFFMAFADDVSSLSKKSGKSVILKKIQVALFTIREKKADIILNLNLILESPEDAENISQIVTGIIAMINLQKEEKESKTKFPADINVSTDRNKVEITFTYPAEEFIDILSGQKKFPHFFSLGGFYPLI